MFHKCASLNISLRKQTKSAILSGAFSVFFSRFNENHIEETIIKYHAPPRTLQILHFNIDDDGNDGGGGGEHRSDV